MTTLSERLDRYSLHIALLTALVATLGSLYFSEVAGFIPCELCWYQRILMYPLAGILTIGLLRRDEHLPTLVIPFALLGLTIAGYHYLLEKTDWFSGHTCKMGVPCTIAWINWYGFITIPFLSLVAFAIILVMSVIAWQAGEPFQNEESGAAWPSVVGVIVVVVLAYTILYGLGTQSAVVTPPVVTQAVESTAKTPPGGQKLYDEVCALCHGANGEGVAGLGNQLAGSPFIQAQSDEQLLTMIRAGRAKNDPGNQSGLVMPPSGGRPQMSDDEVRAVIGVVRALKG